MSTQGDTREYPSWIPLGMMMNTCQLFIFKPKNQPPYISRSDLSPSLKLKDIDAENDKIFFMS